MRRKILQMKRGSTTGMKKTSREPPIPVTHGDPTQHSKKLYRFQHKIRIPHSYKEQEDS
jgi:hypothetical protein